MQRAEPLASGEHTGRDHRPVDPRRAAGELDRRIRQGAGAEDLQEWLDAQSHAARVAAVRGLSRRAEAALYARVADAGSLTLDALVPAGTPLHVPVRHFGLNSLPAFRVFEKRFYRVTPGSDAGAGIAGANFQTLSPLTGPGYFVVRTGQPGELLVDYNHVPSEAPKGWPAIAPNDRGRQRLVYGFMIDTLRRVSEHVSIGRAARKGVEIDAYFVLCREAPV
jgi:hypothetical protein